MFTSAQRLEVSGRRSPHPPGRDGDCSVLMGRRGGSGSTALLNFLPRHGSNGRWKMPMILRWREKSSSNLSTLVHEWRIFFSY